MSLPQPALYQPTDAEIIKVTASAKHRNPALASRIVKACDILLNGNLQLEPVAWEVGQHVRWHIASQSHSGAYIVCGVACPCQDMAAPMVSGTRFCKHGIAVASYLKILRTHLNANIFNRELDLGILPNGEFHAYGTRMGYVQCRKMGCAYNFINAASAVHYSLWLAAQRPLMVSWPVAAAVAA